MKPGARGQPSEAPEAGPSPSESEAKAAAAEPSAVIDQQSLYSQQLAEVPELASYGPVLKSSLKPIELTERETEYVVTAVKHIFKEHIVFQASLASAPDLARNTLTFAIVQRPQYAAGHRAGTNLCSYGAFA